MQRIRRFLEQAGVPVAAEQKPPDFETEGTALAAAVAWLVLNENDRRNKLGNAFVDFQQTAENELARPRYGAAKAVIKELLRGAPLPAGLVEEMRTALKL